MNELFVVVLQLCVFLLFLRIESKELTYNPNK